MTHVEDRHSCVSSLSKPRHLTALLGPGVQSHGPEVHSQACSPSVTHHTALTVVFRMPFPVPTALHHCPAPWPSGFPVPALDCQPRGGRESESPEPRTVPGSLTDE